MKRNQFYRSCVACWILAIALAVVCPVAFGQTLPKNHRATISPSVVHLDPKQEQRFKVVMIATRLMAADVPKAVTWSVNDIPGGNESVGTINAEGVYKAPAKTPSPREIHIVVEVPDAANKFLFATVIVGKEAPRYKSAGIWSEPVLNADTHSSEHMTDPHGIGLDIDGNILIADQLGSKVLRYTREGKFLGELGKGNYAASWFSLFQGPTWVAYQQLLSDTTLYNPFKSAAPELQEAVETLRTDGENVEAAQAINRFVTENAWFAPWFRPAQLYYYDAATVSVVPQVQMAVPAIYNYSPAS